MNAKSLHYTHCQFCICKRNKFFILYDLFLLFYHFYLFILISFFYLFDSSFYRSFHSLNGDASACLSTD